MLRKLSATLFAALLVTSFAACSSDSDDEPAESSTTTEATEESTEESTDDESAAEDDKAEPQARKLVESVAQSDLGSQFEAAGVEVDEAELESCILGAMADDPSLLDVDYDNLDPTSPDAAAVMDAFFGCFPQDAMVGLIVNELESDPSIPAEVVTCVEDELLALDPDDLSALILDAAAGETASMEAALGGCIPS